MAQLVPVDHDPFGAAAPAAPAAPQLIPVDHDPFGASAAPEKMSVGRDVLRSIGTGLVKGAAGIPGMISNAADLPLSGLGWLVTHGLEAAGAVPKGAADAAMSNPPSTRPGSGIDGLAGTVMAAAGGEHVPQTPAGQAAETVSSFLPGSALAANPKGLLDAAKTVPGAMLKYGLLPGAASETAGRLTEGTGFEPGARVLGALAGGLPGMAFDWRNALPQATVGKAVSQLSEPELAQASELIRGGATVPEAFAKVTGGRVDMTDMQRVLEKSDGGQPVFSQYMSQRPDANRAMAQQAFTGVAPPVANPLDVAPRVQTAAQGAVAATPEGQALTQATASAGPRTTPEMAGAAIRNDLARQQDTLTMARSAEADPRYAAARSSQTPIDTDPLLQHINSRLAVTKGDISAGIETARKNLFVGTAPDTSVAGLMESRKALGDQVNAATRAGNNQLASELMDIRGRLDTALEQAPEVRDANRTFQRLSQPLEPFGDGRAPGQALERDPFNRRYTMPAGDIPAAIERGGTRDFAQAGGPAGQQAFQGYLRTKLLDAATDPSTGAVSSQSIRAALRDNADLLRQHPDVTKRLEAVAAAREGMAPVERSTLGQLSAAENFPQQATVLFNPKPLPGSELQVGSAVSQVARRDPDAARALVRMKLEQSFNDASSNNALADQRTGATFARNLLKDPQEARNLEAAVRALPNGDQAWSGMRKVFDIFEAQGNRQGAGSQTTNNTRIQEALKGGGVGEDLATAFSPKTWPGLALDWYQDFKYGANTEKWAKLFTDPEAIAEMNRLRIYPSNSPKAFERAAALLGRAFSAEDQRSITKPR